ncbi:hypothetical protein C8R46DRAFT_1211227 [Mycena filopes]|nr:hypothetical protein C8R46DRAFT_1211227 [Mycena filopes]
MITLPLEVEYRILALLPRYDERTIRICGLVCKAWLHFSRAKRFPDVTLTQRNVASFVDIMATSLLPVYDFIRSMNLESTLTSESTETADRFTALRRLGDCPKLEYLHLTLDDFQLGNHSGFLGSVFTDLTYLSLTITLSQHPSIILDAIACFPTLEYLQIRCTPDNFFANYSIRSSYEFPANLDEVEMDDQDFFAMISTLDSVPVFSSVTMHWCYLSDDSGLGKYLLQTGDQIHHLSFEACSFSDLDIDSAPLRQCTGLRSIRLESEDSNWDTLSCLLMYLLSLPSNSCSLTHIYLRVDAHSCAVGTELPDTSDLWRAIDDALKAKKFAQLEAFTITGLPERYWKPLKEQLLVSSEARGTLRFGKHTYSY